MADPGGQLCGDHRQPRQLLWRSDGDGRARPVALLDFAASGRLAVGEALTNIAATQIGELQPREAVVANWMAAAGHPGVKTLACMRR
ncbi:hypothetical protein MJ563_20535 [Klebsiella pneumoniae]|nr:hypothetical protein MJ563_20535 [Klebsiella pneumoniae]